MFVGDTLEQYAIRNANALGRVEVIDNLQDLNYEELNKELISEYIERIEQIRNPPEGA